MILLLLIFSQFYSTTSVSHEFRSFREGEKWVISSNEVGVFFKELEAGFSFSIYEPGWSNLFQRRMDLTKKFIVYEGDFLSIRVGSYYTNIGRGILLNVSGDETVLLDRFIDGLLIEFQKEIVGFKSFTGIPKNYLYYKLTDSTDFIAGGDFYFSSGRFYIGAGTTYLKSKDFLGKKRETYFAGLNTKFSFGNFDIYSELCGRKGWDVHFYTDTSGYAIFSGVSYSVEGFSLRIETKDYKRFGYTYSLPPPLNHYGIYLNNARDEKGYEIECAFSLKENIYLTLDYSKTTSEMSDGLLEEFFGSLKYIGKVVQFSISGDNIFLKNAMGIGLPKRREFTPNINLTFVLPYGLGIETRFSRRKRDELLLSYVDKDFLFSISKFPYIDISFAFEKRIGGLKEEWKRVEFYLHPAYNFDVEFVIGKRRSDLVCSGGICRYEPEFDGFLLKLIFRSS